MSNSRLKNVRIEQHPTPSSPFHFELDLDNEAVVLMTAYPQSAGQQGGRLIMLTNLTGVDLIWIRNTINDAINKSQ